MAVDFQVCFPQETIAVNKVRALPGDLKVLEIEGEDFSAVDTVSVNDIDVPEFAVLSSHVLRARLPLSLTLADVRTVTVLSKRLVTTAKSTLKFRIGSMPSKVRGPLRLSQLFLKVLFSEPGTDIFNKKGGGGALKALSSTFAASDSGGVINDFSVAVRTTTRQIIASQSRNPSLPPDEKLLSASIISSAFSPQEAALSVSIEIINQSGLPAILNLVV
jgi:hypothetical protein